MWWNDTQIKLINQFLEQEAPKLIDRRYVGVEINERNIEALSRDLQKLLRSTFASGIDIRSTIEMPDRIFTIYLVQGEKYLVQVLTGKL